jgi:hypothetical protein
MAALFSGNGPRFTIRVVNHHKQKEYLARRAKEMNLAAQVSASLRAVYKHLLSEADHFGEPLKDRPPFQRRVAAFGAIALQFLVELAEPDNRPRAAIVLWFRILGDDSPQD